MRIRTLLAVALVAAGLVALPRAAHADPTAKKAHPKVEVVFCIDTTGSMQGLIDGAKQKIWAICNQIASGKPTPDLKVGLVAYRDRGDEYITKTFELTDDLDSIHGHLMALKADGGGDEPESVNEALHVAVNHVNWSHDKNVLRIIYLVGDAPPHMDYPNDIHYPTTCKAAVEKGIIINTIQCGSIQSTTPFWKEIAHLSEGRFVQVAQDGGVQTVSTPFDKRLAEINSALTQTAVVYGNATMQSHGYALCEQAITQAPCAAPRGGAVAACAPMSAPAMCSAADRAGYCARTGQVGQFDLLDNIKAGKVKLEDVRTEELPTAMQKMTVAERRTYLAKIEQDRSKLQTEALELDRKRSDYIRTELNRTSGTSGFDAQVVDMLREQARKVNIAY
jgi:hypothetical protein